LPSILNYTTTKTTKQIKKKIPNSLKDWAKALVVEHLSRKRVAVSSNPSPYKKKKNTEKASLITKESQQKIK
jgi:hypothetical protein